MSADNYFIEDQNATCFLTFTVTDWVDIFTRKDYKFVITDSLTYCIRNKGLTVFAWCLMSNHLHLVCCAEEGFEISNIIRLSDYIIQNKIFNVFRYFCTEEIGQIH